MTENKEIKKDQLQVDFEEAIAAKDKRIYTLEQEKRAALSAQSKLITELDNQRAEREVALSRAERAEARYLRNTELETKTKQEEESLLNKLFN